MDKSPHSFLTEKIGNFFEGLYNFILFFPYFFSVTALLRTLFSPWKGLTDTQKKKSFSFNDIMNTMMFNIISSGIGFTMRVTLLLFFFVFQSVYILSIPLVVLIFFATLPLQFFVYSLSPSDAQKRQRAEEQFLKTHVLKPENQEYVKQWFEKQYDEKYKKGQWWKLENLLNTTPLARDWTLGYTPHLDNYAIDLTDPAYQSHIGHMIGRNKEIAQVEQALLKADEANVIIVGEEGVGKHTIVDSFAQNIYKGLCNPLLAYRRVLKLQMEKILSKFQDGKEREQFFDQLLSEASHSHGVILCIDNFDKYISSGSPDRVDLTGPIETYGQTNKIQIIGLTSPFAYDKFIFFNEKIRNIFTKLDVAEISKQEALQILLDANHEMEMRYRLYIPFETLQAIIEKSDFFITDIPFPEKAIQLLDTACVYTNEKLKQKVLMPDIIDTVLSERTHTPTTLTADIKTKLLSLEKELEARVVNQTEAIHDLAAAMRRAFLLLGKRRKPLTSFLFLGPTGVGKTETAKAIASTFFGSENAIMRFDMSLYQSKDDIPKLVGSSETQNPGLLSDSVRQHPYGVLLLDEIEKADKNLLNIFLTILDEGYFMDGFGKRVDCKNLVIIATSNAGADYLFERMKGVSTGGPAITTNELIDYLIKKSYYTPEFLNRFDGVIAYKPISSNSMIPIARKMLTAIEAQIYELYKVKLEVSDATLEAVLQRNFDPAFGARNLDRALRNEIEDPAAQIILAGKAQPGSTIKM
jgi:ATP-dependent Clp protease ATP-binding subunit ClpA